MAKFTLAVVRHFPQPNTATCGDVATLNTPIHHHNRFRNFALSISQSTFFGFRRCWLTCRSSACPLHSTQWVLLRAVKCQFVMCQWNPDNKHPKRKCRHGHRHHEVLYNEIVPSEPPVVWCNAPDCWTICSYGLSPKVYWGALSSGSSI